MVRLLSMRLEEFEFKSHLKPFSRDSTYGSKIVEKRTENGEVLRDAYLVFDGTHILTSGSLSSSYFDENGNVVSKTIVVDEKGKEIHKVPSTYKSLINLTDTISISDYFCYDIERTYTLGSEDEEELNLLLLDCQILFEQNKLIKFQYAYLDTIEPLDAILIPKDDTIVVVTGKYSEPEMLETTRIVYADEEEELEEEIDFDVW